MVIGMLCVGTPGKLMLFFNLYGSRSAMATLITVSKAAITKGMHFVNVSITKTIYL